MNHILDKSDTEILINFYRDINMYDEEDIRHLIDNLNDTIIISSIINNNRITSMIIINIIRNDYYLEKLYYINEDENEIRNLLNYTVSYLRDDERGLNIIYDNFPYHELIHSIMLNIGFKCNFLNLLNTNDDGKIELIKPYIAINDKSDDVKEYLYKKYIDDIKSNNTYLGVEFVLPTIDDIRLENTNIAVIRNEENNVIGVLRFGIVSDFLYLDSLYGESEDVIKDLITLVKNLTDKSIEIGVFPTREKLINLLSILGFSKYQADYILKLR